MGSFNWKHAVTIGLAIAQAVALAYAQSAGHDLIVKGLSVTAAITTLVALWQRSPLSAGSALLLLAVSLGGVTACTKSEQATAKTIGTDAIVIAADVCTEESRDPNEPTWVRIACRVGGDVVRLVVSDATWASIQARAKPAAPLSIADAGAQ